MLEIRLNLKSGKQNSKQYTPAYKAEQYNHIKLQGIYYPPNNTYVWERHYKQGWLTL